MKQDLADSLGRQPLYFQLNTRVRPSTFNGQNQRLQLPQWCKDMLREDVMPTRHHTIAGSAPFSA